jgi:putative transposase
MRWQITLFLLMPNHVHALLCFPRDKSMSEAIRNWKRFHTRVNHVIWQEGYSIIRYDLTNAVLRYQPR